MTYLPLHHTVRRQQKNLQYLWSNFSTDSTSSRRSHWPWSSNKSLLSRRSNRSRRSLNAIPVKVSFKSNFQFKFICQMCNIISKKKICCSLTRCPLGPTIPAAPCSPVVPYKQKCSQSTSDYIFDICLNGVNIATSFKGSMLYCPNCVLFSVLLKTYFN